MSLSEETVKIGSRYRVIKSPPHFHNTSYDNIGENLVGQIGICKWANFRGICMKFPGGNGYTIPYDCLEEESKGFSRKPFRSTPTSTTADINKEIYRVAKLPDKDLWSAGMLGKICSIVIIDGNRDVVVTTDGGITYLTIPINCLEYVGD